ncbi:hypothetical protein, partial [Thiolapillus sp.]|uniref:hypothetical protein n=1 Tax=Thiolapillus sp. TaxID=2017437 RepID=UPI0025E6742E
TTRSCCVATLDAKMTNVAARTSVDTSSMDIIFWDASQFFLNRLSFIAPPQGNFRLQSGEELRTIYQAGRFCCHVEHGAGSSQQEQRLSNGIPSGMVPEVS